MASKKGQREEKVEELKKSVEDLKEPVKAFAERVKSAVGNEAKSFAEDAKELGKEAKKQGSKVEKASKTVKSRAKKVGATLSGKETAVKVFVEFEGRQLAVEELTARAKEAYLAENPAAEIESLELYVKPEENAAYYVVNGDASPSYKLAL